MIEMRLRAMGTIDDFLEKVSGVNKPFKAIVKTDAYQEFHAEIAKAKNAQAAWAADNLHHILELASPLAPLNDVQTERAKNYVAQNMPSLGSLIDQQKVVDHLIYCFEWGAKAQYQRWFTKKAAAPKPPEFTLTNQRYISALQDHSNYLLNQSNLDDTEADDIIGLISAGKQDMMTNDEIAQQLKDSFDEISQMRADRIARTETANAMEDGSYAAMQENGVQEYDWVTAGDNPCQQCQDNADGSPYTVGSGDEPEFPAHPNDECYRQGDPSSIDLSTMSIWDGGDN